MSGNVFVIDTARCTGCHACAMACKDRADLPDEVDWLLVKEREAGTCPETTLSFHIVHCFHCDEPPCVEACPARALAKIEGGFVALDAAACTGCGDCVGACPFGAVAALSDGTATKCDGCADEVAEGRSPACVRACPMGALGYGLVDDAGTDGRMSDRAFEDHAARPSVLYLSRDRTSPDGA